MESYYVVVARRKAWTLSYPRHLWEAMTPGEREDVVVRQQALFDAMAREDGRRRRAAKRKPHASTGNPMQALEPVL